MHSFWQRAATNMVYHRLRTNIYLVARQLHAPAEIDLFLVCEKELIEAMQPVIQFRLHEHGCPTGPEHWGCIIELAFIFFTNIKYPSSRKWVTEIIKPPSCRSGISRNIRADGTDAISVDRHRYFYRIPLMQ